MKWLEHQTGLRRASYNNQQVNSNPNPFQRREPPNRSSVATSIDMCLSCSAPDHLGEFPEFLQLNHDG